MARQRWSHSGPQHGRDVSVGAVDPGHQGQRHGHKGPRNALGACSKRAALGRPLQTFTQVQVVPRRILQHLVQQDDGQRDLQHHHPLGGVQGRDLEDDLQRAPVAE